MRRLSDSNARLSCYFFSLFFFRPAKGCYSSLHYLHIILCHFFDQKVFMNIASSSDFFFFRYQKMFLASLIKYFLLPLCFLLLVLLLSFSKNKSDSFKLFTQNCVDNQSCALSLSESNDFICEPDVIWKERKIVYQHQDKENMVKRQSSIFFLSNWEPNFHCSHSRRVGSMGDGGKWICDVFRLNNRANCLVYSFGSSGEFSFEASMKTILPHCEIHTFDSATYHCPSGQCIFHQAKLGSGLPSSGTKDWSMIIDELQHRNRTIDIMKIDIEGGEYDFFPTIFKTSESLHPQQILVELHPKDPKDIHAFFELLRNNHYTIFNKEPNLIAGREFFEYAFLKLNKKFFE